MTYFKKVLVSSIMLLCIFSFFGGLLEIITDYLSGTEFTQLPFSSIIGLFFVGIVYGGLIVAMIIVLIYNKAKKWIRFTYIQGYVIIGALVLTTALIFLSFYYEIRFSEVSTFILFMILGFAVNFLNEKYLIPK